MAVLYPSPCSITKPSSSPGFHFLTQIPKTQSFPLNNTYPKALSSTLSTLNPKDSLFTLPNWRSGRNNDPRTQELKLNDAFLDLEYMVGKGHKPDVPNATQLLHDLCKCNELRKAARLMEMMVKSGSVPDPTSYTFLVNSLCRRGDFGHTTSYMEEYGFPSDTMTYNYLLRGLCRRGNLKETLRFFEKSTRKGLIPDAFTYSTLVQAAYEERGIDEAVRLLGGIISAGGDPDLMSYNVILTGLCGEGRVEDAVRLLRSLRANGFNPDVVSYNILLRSLCDRGRWEEANGLLSEMDGDDRSPSIMTYNILIDSLVAHGLTDRARDVLVELLRDGRFKPGARSYNPLLARLCEEGRVDDVLKCLDEMISRNCRPNEGLYNAIALLCNKGMVREAFSIIRNFRTESDWSIDNLYKTVVSNLCRKGNTYAAFKLLYEMTSCGEYTPESHTYSSLISGLCLERRWGAAMGVFKVMEDSGYRMPDVDNYNALVLGLCKCGRTDLSVDVLEMMVGKGYVPNKRTYSILVEGLIHEGEKELAAGILKELHSRRVLRRNTVERLSMHYDLDALSVYRV